MEPKFSTLKIIMHQKLIKTQWLTDLGLMSTRSWSKFIPGMMMVIFLGPLNPSTFVSCKTPTILYHNYKTGQSSSWFKFYLMNFSQLEVINHYSSFFSLIYFGAFKLPTFHCSIRPIYMYFKKTLK